MKADAIEIHQLRLSTFIGVPDEERAAAQQLEVSLWITPVLSFEAMGDEIAATLDYYQLTLELEELALARPRKLIETFAADIAAHVLAKECVQAVEVLVEKFILPQTRCVAVRMARAKC